MIEPRFDALLGMPDLWTSEAGNKGAEADLLFASVADSAQQNDLSLVPPLTAPGKNEHCSGNP